MFRASLHNKLMPQTLKSRWRFVWYPIVALALANVAYQFMASAHHTAVLKEAKPWILILAIACQIASYAVLTPIMVYFYRQARIDISWPRAFGLVLAGTGLAKVVPFGEYLFWRSRLRHERDGVGTTTHFMILYLTFGLTMLTALFIITESLTLLLYPTTQAQTLARAFVWVPIILSVAIAAAVATASIPRVRSFLRNFASKQLGSEVISPFSIIHRRRLDSSVLGTFAGGFALAWLLEAGTLQLCLNAFGQSPPFILTIFGYSFARLFTFIPILPGGIGEVEAATTIFFAAYGYPAGYVLTATILFRFISYWLPIIIGVLTYFGIKKSPVKAMGRAIKSGVPAAE
jgi:Mg2+-importing ATPase